MVLPLSPAAASQWVVWGGLLLGMLLGAAAQSTRFCTMGALADWFGYGGTPRLLMWVLAVAVAGCGALLLVEFAWLDASRTHAWSPRLLWLSNSVGGLVFGFGMVLAAGCPQRNLVKAGTGNLKAWLTLLVTGVSAQMTLRGVFAEPRVHLLDAVSVTLPYPQDLGSVLVGLGAGNAMVARWGVLVVYGLVVAVLVFRSRHVMERSHYLGGLAIGLLVPLAWALTGHVGYLPEHPDTLEPAWMGTYTHRPEALSFTAPLAHGLDLLTLWSDRNNIVTYGITVCIGTVVGSALSAVLRREFRVESLDNVADLPRNLLGAVLMGFGGVTAMGCSIGQGVSGMSLQSVGAMLAVAGIVAGVWLALKLQMWQLHRQQS